MIFGIPLAILLGILTFISLITTALFGIAVFKFGKANLFRYHKFFAFTTITIAVIHFVFAFLLWFKGIVI
jgi:hypothetical protein